jgi:hypothetical protein
VLLPSVDIEQLNAWLVYDKMKPLPPMNESAEVYDGKSQDDLKFIPLDGQQALGPVTQQYVQLPLKTLPFTNTNKNSSRRELQRQQPEPKSRLIQQHRLHRSPGIFPLPLHHPPSHL